MTDVEETGGAGRHGEQTSYEGTNGKETGGTGRDGKRTSCAATDGAEMGGIVLSTSRLEAAGAKWKGYQSQYKSALPAGPSD